jgi:hypothetical protein
MLGQAGYYNQTSTDEKENSAGRLFKAIGVPIARIFAPARIRKICGEEKEAPT